MNDWLWQRVVLNRIRVGRVVDVILQHEDGEVVGFEVRCEDGRHRFLPRAAADATGTEITIQSPLALLDPDELDFYRQRGVSLRSRQEPAA